MPRPSDAQVAFLEGEHRRLVGSLTLYTGDPELAADLAQEALARACVHWSRVSTMEAPGAWLHRVGINLANSWFQRRLAEGRAHRRRGSAAESHTSADPSDDVARSLTVRRAVAALPRRQRAAVALRYFADLSVRDTATAMRCAEGTVAALTHQGLANLRRSLGAHEQTGPSAHPRGGHHADRPAR